MLLQNPVIYCTCVIQMRVCENATLFKLVSLQYFGEIFSAGLCWIGAQQAVLLMVSDD